MFRVADSCEMQIPCEILTPESREPVLRFAWRGDHVQMPPDISALSEEDVGS